MTTSLDSDRPILAATMSEKAKRRASTLSAVSSSAPSLTPSQYSREAGILEITNGINRLDVPRLQEQRFVLTEKKGGELGKLALGAKLERALGRRMTGQDAVFRKKKAKVVVQ
ncbi:hypothetical protein AA313_de0205504 [Arthrobotrys entomopaga]|nr:hypothetical protein AA313_de0205504 [Arthrobotrys entomopaga]